MTVFVNHASAATIDYFISRLFGRLVDQVL